jgi:protease IV
MKDFIKSVVAGLLALSLFFGAGFVLVLGIASVMGKGPHSPETAVLTLDLSRPIGDSNPEPSPSELVSALSSGSAGALPLSVLTRSLDRASSDKKIVGLFISGTVQRDGWSSGPAALRELKAAIARFKASGKPVIAYNMSWSKQSLYVASGASTVFVHPMGTLDVGGLASEGLFLADAFKKYGIEVQVTRVGKYKSAIEPLINNHRSDADREQTQAYLDDVWGDWKASIAADRAISIDALQALADDKAILDSSEALAAKLVDQVAPYDEVLTALRAVTKVTDNKDPLPQMSLGEYSTTTLPPEQGANAVAVDDVTLGKDDGEGGSKEIGGQRVARELRKVRLDDDIKAVVLRVNSPGGSATASDLIQREVLLIKDKKPIVVSMGTVAASGGYWISTYASRIFAEPNTLTGSIGVFGILPNVQKLLSEHGVNVDSVQTAKLGSWQTLSRPKTELELARVQHVVDGIYARFIEKVAQGRGLEPSVVRDLAQGRVWTGSQALKLHLVDELGGLDEAIASAVALAKIDKNYRLQGLPSRKPNLQRLLRKLNQEEEGEAESTVGHLFGNALKSVAAELQALERFNDPMGVYARLESSALPW